MLSRFPWRWWITIRYARRASDTRQPEEFTVPIEREYVPKPGLRFATFPADQRKRLIEIANRWSLDLLGMDQAAGQECVRRAAAKVDIVVVLFPDPDALPDHDGISFAVIKGFELCKAGEHAGKSMMALALADEWQAITAEQDFGDQRSLN
jgi:hypothetical protein